MSIMPPDAARIGDGSPVADVLRSISSREFVRVRRELAENPDRDLAVHQSRKALKRVRAMLRLVRPSLGAGEFAAEDGIVRDVGRVLAPLRDTAVTLDTIGAVHPGGCPILTRRLAERHRALMDAAWVGETVALRANASLDGIETRWGGLFARIEGHDFEAVQAGITRTFRRGRKRMNRVTAKPDADSFHEWRKEVKYLRYQLEAMSPMDEAGLTALISALDDLGEMLGSEHDLTVLGQCATAEDACGDELAGLLVILESRATELRARALTLGPRVYEQKPGAFAHGLADMIGPRGGPARLD